MVFIFLRKLVHANWDCSTTISEGRTLRTSMQVEQMLRRWLAILVWWHGTNLRSDKYWLLQGHTITYSAHVKVLRDHNVKFFVLQPFDNFRLLECSFTLEGESIRVGCAHLEYSNPSLKLFDTYNESERMQHIGFEPINVLTCENISHLKKVISVNYFLFAMSNLENVMEMQCARLPVCTLAFAQHRFSSILLFHRPTWDLFGEAT